jgi:4-carboxymuconolactone decarboxylase
VGNDKVTLLSVVTQLLPYVGYPRALNAVSCLNEVIPEPSQPGHRHQTE